MSLLYGAVDTGLNMQIKGVCIFPYMPDNPLEGNGIPLAVPVILSAAATIAVFLPVSIRVFDRRDV